MELIYAENHGPVTLLKINRPKALNALNKALLLELYEFFEFTVRREKIRVVVITGEGNRAFIAGADIKEMSEMSHLDALEFCRIGQKVSLALEKGPCVTIAAVNGYALGGGLEMALSCDFIYASSTAKLGLPEVTLGLLPGFGGTQRLVSAVGVRKAKEMIFTGKPIDAEEALALGLVNKVIEPEGLIQAALETAKSIAAFSEIAVLQSKNAVNAAWSTNLLESLELERNMFAVTFATPERERGMQTFLNKGKKE